MLRKSLLFCAFALPLPVPALFAQEPPYFVTYSSVLEEPDNLELNLKATAANPTGDNGFAAQTLELEYGMRAWWTTEVYLTGVAVANDSTIFTGVRWENRFHLLPRQHWFNPVLYAEFEDHNDADRSLLEVVGNDGKNDVSVSNTDGRASIERELELKLIVDSNFKGWNVAENFISERNFNAPEPWEFGYAVGVARPLALAASGHRCNLCAENFSVGAEMYGGLSTTDSFGLHDTSHYAGPTVQWNVPRGPTIQLSPNFGLNGNSLSVIYRFSVSYEVQQFLHSLVGEGR